MGRGNPHRAAAKARKKALGRPVYTPPVSVDKIVVPLGRCYFVARKGLLMFTAEDVERALAQAQKGRDRTGSGHRETGTFPCPPGGCGYHHLTSRTDDHEGASS